MNWLFSNILNNALTTSLLVAGGYAFAWFLQRIDYPAPYPNLYSGPYAKQSEDAPHSDESIGVSQCVDVMVPDTPNIKSSQRCR